MFKLRTAIVHLLAWSILIGLPFSLMATEGSFRSAFVRFVVFGVLNMLIFYINYLFLLPKYLNSRRFWGCALSIVALLFISTGIKLWLSTYFLDVFYRELKYEVIYYSELQLRFFLFSLVIGIIVVIVSTGLRFATDWFTNEKIRKNLENEKLTAELAFLKSQINPHFLFNSLNNIYALSYRQSPATPEAILKLSQMMRYMLTESNDIFVPLEKELQYINNYIELQRLRFKDGGAVVLDTNSPNEKYYIAPLILIPFIENAFKHGVATDEENPITIKISTDMARLDFNLKNKTSPHNKDESSGVGLNNVYRRLNLLYPERYTLEIEESDSYYSCHLVLEL